MDGALAASLDGALATFLDAALPAILDGLPRRLHVRRTANPSSTGPAPLASLQQHLYSTRFYYFLTTALTLRDQFFPRKVTTYEENFVGLLCRLLIKLVCL
jgi:hypothetical protein